MKPYRIAICEDDQVERQHLYSMCEALLNTRQIPHELSLFASADVLGQAIEQDCDAFDLLLLDIQMEGKSGMMLAKELYHRQITARVLFITGCAEYALEAYEVHPIHYLIKPVEPFQLEDVLVRDWKEHHQIKTVLLRSGGRTMSLPVKDILYMESRNHTLMIYTGEAEYSFSISLSEVEKLVPPELFCRCHRSFLVNIRQVEEISRLELKLQDGTRIPMGRSYYRSFQTAFIHFMNQNSR